MNLFVCYKPCTTCSKARKWLDAHGIAYKERDIKSQPPTEDELRRWAKMSGLPLKRFFNTSGQVYRTMGLSKKLPDMSDDEKLKLLATDGMLVKRPVFAAGDTVLVGFKEPEWQQALL